MLPDFIKPIILPTPFQVGDVNIYLIDDEQKILIDCGCKTDACYNALAKKLKDFGLRCNDIDQVWLTHAHPDHAGLAQRFQKEHGAKVGIHQMEWEYMKKGILRDEFVHFFKNNGIPEALVFAMGEGRKWYETYYDEFEPDFFILENTPLKSGAHTFLPKLMPGHAPGHVIFIHDEVFLAGDVLLEQISSNALLNFDLETLQRINALGQLRTSLEWFAGQQKLTLPGHGRWFKNPTEIAKRHLKAQEIRYRLVVGTLKTKAQNLFEITLQIFPQAAQPAQAFLCLSEITGYLDLAVSRGDAFFDEGSSVYFHSETVQKTNG